MFRDVEIEAVSEDEAGRHAIALSEQDAAFWMESVACDGEARSTEVFAVRRASPSNDASMQFRLNSRSQVDPRQSEGRDYAHPGEEEGLLCGRGIARASIRRVLDWDAGVAERPLVPATWMGTVVAWISTPCP